MPPSAGKDNSPLTEGVPHRLGLLVPALCQPPFAPLQIVISCRSVRRRSSFRGRAARGWGWAREAQGGSERVEEGGEELTNRGGLRERLEEEGKQVCVVVPRPDRVQKSYFLKTTSDSLEPHVGDLIIAE